MQSREASWCEVRGRQQAWVAPQGAEARGDAIPGKAETPILHLPVCQPAQPCHAPSGCPAAAAAAGAAAGGREPRRAGTGGGGGAPLLHLLLLRRGQRRSLLARLHCWLHDRRGLAGAGGGGGRGGAREGAGRPASVLDGTGAVPWQLNCG